jgi:NitT/TauT family transport system ATP-binding protein
MSTPIAPVLQVDEITAAFTDRRGILHVLDKVSFDVQLQEFVCVLGPSGSGKSTLLRLLAGLLKPVSGELHFRGTPIKDTDPGIGLVFQAANLMPWRTVMENIQLPLEVDGRMNGGSNNRSQEMIELVGLQGFEDSLPRDLSGGMAQRVAIARALVQDPEVLLLDEPFGSLDAITRERMGAELLRIWRAQQKTVVMVTHDISEAVFLADRVLVLSNRPAKIKLDLKIELPRPRQHELRYTVEFGRLASELRGAIE